MLLSITKNFSLAAQTFNSLTFERSNHMLNWLTSLAGYCSRCLARTLRTNEAGEQNVTWFGLDI